MTERLIKRLDALGQQVEDEIQAGRMTGASVSVAEKGVILWEAGFGFADVDAKKRATEHTPFSLASVTKPFTASAFMTLVQAGKLELDRAISDYLAQPLPQSEFDPRAITPRLLGGHAAGLPMLFGMTGDSSEGLSFVESVRDFARMVYPAGERYEYSNIGYSLLADAAGHVMGRSFSSLLHTNIIEPMGLYNTFYQPDEHRIRDAAIGYHEQGVAIPFYTTATPPSGELYASAHDVSIFAANMMMAPFPGHPTVLGSEMLRAMFTPVHQGGGDAFTAFGWEGCHVGGERVIIKRGGQPGVTARLTMLVARNISIAFVANRTDNQAIVEKLSSEIASLFVPGWKTPELEPVDAIAGKQDSSRCQGVWAGTISNGGIEQAVRLEIGAKDSQWTIVGGETRRIDTLSWEHGALGFNSSGVIPGRITCEQSLAFKLVERNGRLLGRCLAVVGAPPQVSTPPYFVSMLSYFVTLSRV